MHYGQNYGRPPNYFLDIELLNQHFIAYIFYGL